MGARMTGAAEWSAALVHAAAVFDGLRLDAVPPVFHVRLMEGLDDRPYVDVHVTGWARQIDDPEQPGGLAALAMWAPVLGEASPYPLTWKTEATAGVNPDATEVRVTLSARVRRVTVGVWTIPRPVGERVLGEALPLIEAGAAGEEVARKLFADAGVAFPA